MRNKKRTETVIETHEVWVIRRPEEYLATSCISCPGQSPMIKPEMAAELIGVSIRTIYRWVEADRLHFVEPPEGGLFVCLTSLTATAA